MPNHNPPWNRVDLTGRVFERLTVLARGEPRGHKTRWAAQCSCGAVKLVNHAELMAGKTKSCGCLNVEARKMRPATHGYSESPTYVCWSNMHARCSNPKRKEYKNYGGRGISVCERWASFESFVADMGDKPPRLSIDRINNDGNYEPSNCRWATAKQQRANQRRAAAAIGEQREG